MGCRESKRRGQATAAAPGPGSGARAAACLLATLYLIPRQGTFFPPIMLNEGKTLFWTGVNTVVPLYCDKC